MRAYSGLKGLKTFIFGPLDYSTLAGPGRLIDERQTRHYTDYPMPAALPNPLLDLHRRADAETQPYDTLEIVTTFGQPQIEYAALRKNVALMDEPYRGVLELTGRDRLSFLNNQITNDVWTKATKTGLSAGRVVYAFYLNLKGRVVCDLNVIELGGRTLVEMDVRLVAPLRATLDRYLFTEDVKLIDRTGDLHQIALHGPNAFQFLTMISRAGVPLTVAPDACMTFRWDEIDVIAWRDDVCGVPGVHLICPAAAARDLWTMLTTESAAMPKPAKPLGWAAFNAARIEAGRPLFGIDFELAPPSLPGKSPGEINPAPEAPKIVGVLPAETGLFDRAVSVAKGCYLGQEIVARMYARKAVARKLVGLRIDDHDALPSAGSLVFDTDQNEIGVITSSTMSPLLGDAALVLALMKRPFFEPGVAVRVPAEGMIRTARVVLLPFISPSKKVEP